MVVEFTDEAPPPKTGSQAQESTPSDSSFHNIDSWQMSEKVYPPTRLRILLCGGYYEEEILFGEAYL
jgi:hypothetical protein